MLNPDYDRVEIKDITDRGAFIPYEVISDLVQIYFSSFNKDLSKFRGTAIRQIKTLYLIMKRKNIPHGIILRIIAQRIPKAFVERFILSYFVNTTPIDQLEAALNANGLDMPEGLKQSWNDIEALEVASSIVTIKSRAIP